MSRICFPLATIPAEEGLLETTITARTLLCAEPSSALTGLVGTEFGESETNLRFSYDFPFSSL